MNTLKILDRVKTDLGPERFQGIDPDNKLYKVTISKEDWRGGNSFPEKFNDKSPTINVWVEKVEKA